MTVVSIADLKTLVEQAQGSCVSLYMPAVVAGAETQQNSIRFKNLIKEAEKQLQEQHSLRSTDALNLLQPAMDLDHEDFWQNQNQGLAVFVTREFLHYYRLPMPVPEQVIVGDRFLLKPLLPLINEDGEFFILALTQHQVRFFEASRYTIREVEVPDLPQNIDKTLSYDETAQDGQFRISTSRGGTNNSFTQAGGPGAFHGQGSPDRDEHQKDILQFFYAVDHALQNVLHDRQGPLVLATLDYEMAIYREANTYPHLLDEGINENPKILKSEELHTRALPIVEPYFTQSQQAAIDYYYNSTSSGKTSTDPNEIIPASFYGRIEQLLVPVDAHQWGNFDPQSMELQLHPEAQPGDEDLLNAAAIQTLLNGGAVYTVEPDQVPETAPLAAVFRY